MGEAEYAEEDIESDTDTVETTDTAQTTETVDSLYENVKFPEDKNEESRTSTPSVKQKIDLRDLVKQDLKGIVTSVDYFDEEKYEGGKRLKKSKKAKKESKSEEVESSSKDTVSDEAESSQKGVEDGKIVTENESSSKRKETESENGVKKKVKTASGTFNVSKK